MNKFKLDDQVKITAGKDKGQTGKIIKIFPDLDKVTVEGKNTYKKHMKQQSKGSGQIVTLDRPLPVANIAIVCPTCKKATRVGLEGTAKTKVRICKKCHSVISFTKK